MEQKDRNNPFEVDDQNLNNNEPGWGYGFEIEHMKKDQSSDLAHIYTNPNQDLQNKAELNHQDNSDQRYRMSREFDLQRNNRSEANVSQPTVMPLSVIESPKYKQSITSLKNVQQNLGQYKSALDLLDIPFQNVLPIPNSKVYTSALQLLLIPTLSNQAHQDTQQVSLSLSRSLASFPLSKNFISRQSLNHNTNSNSNTNGKQQNLSQSQNLTKIQHSTRLQEDIWKRSQSSSSILKTGKHQYEGNDIGQIKPLKDAFGIIAGKLIPQRKDSQDYHYHQSPKLKILVSQNSQHYSNPNKLSTKFTDLRVLETPKTSQKLNNTNQTQKFKRAIPLVLGQQPMISQTLNEKFFSKKGQISDNLSNTNINGLAQSVEINQYNAIQVRQVSKSIQIGCNERQNPNIVGNEKIFSQTPTMVQVHQLSKSTSNSFKKAPKQSQSVISAAEYSHSEGPITFSQSFKEKVPCNRGKQSNNQRDKGDYGIGNTIVNFIDNSLTNVSSPDHEVNRRKFSSVSIQKHQIIHKSFFMPDYVMYHIKVYFKDSGNIKNSNPITFGNLIPIIRQPKPQSQQSSLNSTIVKRNYMDFQKFRSILQKQYPGFHLPYLQQNSWLSQTNIEFVRKQKAMLQFFLNDLLSNPFLQTSPLLHDFLTIQDHKTMKRTLEKYEIQKRFYVKAIEELNLPMQYIEVKLNQQQKVFSDYLRGYLQLMDNSLSRVKDLFENISISLDTISANMSSISELVNTLERRTLHFFANSSSCNSAPESLTALLSTLSTFSKTQSETHIFQSRLLTSELLPILRYEHCNILNLQNLLELRDSFTKSYLQRINQQSRQLQSYPNHGIQVYLGERCQHGKRASQGLLEQNRDILVMKYQTAYLNTQVCEESMRIFGGVGQKLMINVQEVIKGYMRKSQDEKQIVQGIIEGKLTSQAII